MLNKFAEMAKLSSELLEVTQEFNEVQEKLKRVLKKIPPLGVKNQRGMMKAATIAQPLFVRAHALGTRAVTLQQQLCDVMEELGLPVSAEAMEAMEQTQKGLLQIESYIGTGRAI